MSTKQFEFAAKVALHRAVVTGCAEPLHEILEIAVDVPAACVRDLMFGWANVDGYALSDVPWFRLGRALRKFEQGLYL